MNTNLPVNPFSLRQRRWSGSALPENMSPGLYKTGPKFCFLMNQVCNNLGLANPMSEDLEEEDLMHTTQLRPWNIPQARWYGVPCPMLEHLVCSSYHPTPPWMVPNMSHSYRISWKPAWIPTNARYSCKMVLHVTGPKVVKDFLSKNKVKVLDWPWNSPDLNPIENLWKVVKDKVADRQPSNAKALEDAEKEISVEYCQSLISSMPRRIQEVIRNRGGHTKY